MKYLSYVQINKDSLLDNLSTLKKLSDNKICVVVKGNAYGHGLREVCKILDGQIDYFQIDDYEELIELRKYTNTKVLILGYVQLNKLQDLQKKNAIPGLYNIESINTYKGEYHLKVDTFLGRQGVLTSNLVNFLGAIKNKNMSGVYTHFSNIEDTLDLSHFKKQVLDFREALSILHEYGYRNFETHTNATSGLLINTEIETSINRVGIGIYGMWPSEDLEHLYEKKVGKLKPIIRWVTHIAQIKEVPEGFPIGYGLTYMTKSKKKIAVIPQGYSDGYNRLLSSTGKVLIRGKLCPVLGRVAMNMFVVDVSHIKNVKVEDEVVLIGTQKNKTITAEEIAKSINTINYDVVSAINPLLQRRVL